jgi:hypothetical protein
VHAGAASACAYVAASSPPAAITHPLVADAKKLPLAGMRLPALPAVFRSSDMPDASIVYELWPPVHPVPAVSRSRTMIVGVGAKPLTSKLYSQYVPPCVRGFCDHSEPAEFRLPEKKTVLA